MIKKIGTTIIGLTFLIAGIALAADDILNDPDLNDDLVSYYEFNEATGATRVDSVTGSGNDLTSNNNVAQGTTCPGGNDACIDLEASTPTYLSTTLSTASFYLRPPPLNKPSLALLAQPLKSYK